MVIEALRGFDHNGPREKHEKFVVSDNVGRLLIQKGLAMESKADPRQAGGETLSASPAAPALPEQTQKKSKRGRPRKVKEPS